MEEFFSNLESAFSDRRALPRVVPASKLWAAVENTTRNEMLGMAEVADFSGLGLAVRQIADDPVAALGDLLWVTLVAEEGVIPLRAKLVHIRGGGGLFGLRLEAPSEPGQLFLLRLYERLASSAEIESSPSAG